MRRIQTVQFASIPMERAFQARKPIRSKIQGTEDSALGCSNRPFRPKIPSSMTADFIAERDESFSIAAWPRRAEEFQADDSAARRGQTIHHSVGGFTNIHPPGETTKFELANTPRQFECRIRWDRFSKRIIMQTMSAAGVTGPDGTLILTVAVGPPNAAFDAIVVLQPRPETPPADPWAAVNAVRRNLAATGRVFGDSAELIREDRER